MRCHRTFGVDSVGKVRWAACAGAKCPLWVPEVSVPVPEGEPQVGIRFRRSEVVGVAGVGSRNPWLSLMGTGDQGETLTGRGLCADNLGAIPYRPED